jgi:GNAT superfamily N-acetyltransferase
METPAGVSVPKPLSLRTVLGDGTSVLIRPIRADDKPFLAQGLTRLSERSRYRRFGMVVRELSGEQLRYLTEVDSVNHVAWVAFDVNGNCELLVGVARYIRSENDPYVAEVAVTVADSHQGRGIGTLLLSTLAKSARNNGVQRFLAFVSWDNAPVLKLVREFGAGIRYLGSGIFRVTGAVPNTLESALQLGW